MANISIEALSVSYSGSRVIDALSLDISAGSFFTLLGPSGCGKTTLLRTLAGFAAPDAGAIRFGARDVTHVPAHQRDIGMVFQDYALFPDKTVFDNAAYGLRARKQAETAIRARVMEYLERVGLSGLADRHPAALSGGQRQRVALARALVIAPQVLLMDEPLSNLDAKLRVQVREMIAGLQRESGITTVFVTHDQEEALALSDRIGLMRQGRIEQNAAPRELYRMPASAYVADFVGAANVIGIETSGHADPAAPLAVSLPAGRLSVRAPWPLAAGPAFLIARPEDIRLLSSDSGAPNTLSGTIQGKQYLGGKTAYRIGLAGGLSIRAELHGDDHDAFAEGSPAAAVFDPVKTLVTPS